MTIKQIITSKIFLIGLLIRLFIMPFTGHFDIRGINFAIYNLPYKGITNVYEVAAHGPVDYLVNVNFGRDYFIYPPLNYFTLGSFMTLLKPFYGGEFRHWIEGYGADTLSVLTHPHVWRYLFLMKLPYLFFDIFLLSVLVKFFGKKSEQVLALKYWWLNPIVIYLPYVWGQFDIIPTAVMLAGVLVAIKSKPYESALLFGLAASFKNYPLILLPFIAIIFGKNIWHMVKLMFIGLLPFLLTTMPFWSHEFFRKTVLFSWQSQKMMDFMWAIGGSDGAYPFFIGYFLILMWALYKLRGRADQIFTPMVMTLTWYYATTTFHQQWFLWVLPYFVILAVKDAKLRLIGLGVVILFFMRLISIQGNVTTELLIWLAPAFDDLPKSRYLAGLAYDIHKFRNITNSLFIAVSLFITAYLGSRVKNKV
jgi:hypothetical protein